MTKKSRWSIAATLVAALLVAPAIIQSPAAAAASAAGDIHTYRDTPGDVRSDRFTLSANGEEVFVTKYSNRYNNRMAVARFASDDATPLLTVTANTPITSWKIFPERDYPSSAATVSGNTLSFEMSADQRYVIVEINGSQPGIAIVNDPLEDPATIPDPSASNVVNVMDFVTDATGATDQTSQIRAAVDELYSDATKDTLYFPDGWYTHAGLDLRDRTKPVTIYVAEGALLKNRIQPTMESMEPTIGIWNSKNITFYGRGVYDGNGFANYDTGNGGWRHDAATSQHQGGVMILHSENIVFNDTLARDAKQWNWETHTAKNVTFNNIKGLTPYAQPWVDGINLASGQNITVNGALTLGNDDTFASGHYNPNDKFTPDPDRLNWDTADTFGISVENHLGWTAGAGNGVRIGGGGGYTQKDFRFENVSYTGFKNLGITMGNFTADTNVSFTDASFDTSKVTTNAGIAGRGNTAATRFGSLVFDDVWFSNNLPVNISNTTNLRIHELTVGGTPVTRLTQFPLTLTNVVNRDFDFVLDVAPVFGTIPSSEVDAGTELVLPIPVTDGDGDTVVVSSSALPDGASIVGNVLRWTPVAAQAGTLSIPLLATDSRGATATGAAKVTVIDPDAERIEIPAAADASVQAWNAEQAQNYGDNELLRLLNLNDATLGGVLGEKYAGNQSNRDSKLGLLSFDLGDLGERIAAGELISAELSLTYAGPAKTGLSGTNALVAALATPGWVEGNGKTTPTARTNTVGGAVTWLTKPTIDTTKTATSDPFTVTSSTKVGSDGSYSASQKPVGGKADIDVLALLEGLDAQASTVSFAVNETKKQDLLFVSREGDDRNPNAEGLAPRLTLTFAAEPQETAPGAPTGASVALGDAVAQVSWMAPAEHGSSPVTGYTVTANPGGNSCATTGELTCRVTGLTNGTAYTFAVTATNETGTSPASAPSTPATPSFAPGGTDTVSVSTNARAQCVSAKPSVAVYVLNKESVPVEAAVSTASGTKSVTLAAGKTAYLTFATDASSIDAGAATLVVTKKVSESPVSTTYQAGYAAVNCG
ncbi:hypothetical protein QE375_003576 [Microbacterium foliorum]|uniref:Fibronectin type-III domain-containing protein n=1 Tax=Microbacterium foliorum TaxID=104336 RepID=A0ABU1HVD0_9MICO|nr:fibronectin type III domain-containing protein [Microbacterium foliorum]MDR6144022.1 hypothetical protein [Microbacterium foliorum]